MAAAARSPTMTAASARMQAPCQLASIASAAQSSRLSSRTSRRASPIAPVSASRSATWTSHSADAGEAAPPSTRRARSISPNRCRTDWPRSAGCRRTARRWGRRPGRRARARGLTARAPRASGRRAARASRATAARARRGGGGDRFGDRGLGVDLCGRIADPAVLEQIDEAPVAALQLGLAIARRASRRDHLVRRGKALRGVVRRPESHAPRAARPRHRRCAPARRPAR